MARDDGAGMSPMEQPPTGEEAGTQNKTKDGTGGVPDRKAEVLGLLISPKFPPHFIVAQHFPSSSQGEFPISLPQNLSNQKASTSLAQIPGRNLFGETLTFPLQLTSRVSIAVSLSRLPEWSPAALLLADFSLPVVLYSLSFPSFAILSPSPQSH